LVTASEKIRENSFSTPQLVEDARLRVRSTIMFCRRDAPFFTAVSCSLSPNRGVAGPVSSRPSDLDCTLRGGMPWTQNSRFKIPREFFTRHAKAHLLNSERQTVPMAQKKEGSKM
jgi:hypothetical protein